MDKMGLTGQGCQQLALISYGYQRQMWVWVHVCTRLTSASCQPAICLKDIDDDQLASVPKITDGLLPSTGSAGINKLALLINISFRDTSSGGFHCSTGDIDLVYQQKLGSSFGNCPRSALLSIYPQPQLISGIYRDYHLPLHPVILSSLQFTCYAVAPPTTALPPCRFYQFQTDCTLKLSYWEP